eukprot:NODE_2292_length_489_cov_450.211364_g1878_i0.p1 GENE.NODE_2292_length_489_cov_450.211364_g1878_i0~~NODE_2292_length_489_cov_450.211364_g1878_i0.p1  ORF type:complete len:136 (-),score=23.18 NODE_2292_length_489_cov_450.211364_g1878_i0:81-455(-)
MGRQLPEDILAICPTVASFIEYWGVMDFVDADPYQPMAATAVDDDPPKASLFSCCCPRRQKKVQHKRCRWDVRHGSPAQVVIPRTWTQDDSSMRTAPSREGHLVQDVDLDTASFTQETQKLRSL